MRTIRHASCSRGLCRAYGAEGAAVLRPDKWLPERQESGFRRGGSAC